MIESDDHQMIANSESVVDYAYNCYRDAKQHKELYSKDWGKYYLLYAGKHWPGNQPDWMSTPVINLTFSVIETIVPILTDSRPQIVVAPREPQDEAIASVLGSILEWLWEASDMEVKLPKIMRNAMIFGNGFLKVIWNPELRRGLGDIDIVPVDPAHIFISPFAPTLQESDYVIHAENLPKAKVKRLFPGLVLNEERGPHEADLTLTRNVTNQGTGKSSIERFRLTDGSGVEMVNSSGADNQRVKQDDLVTVLEKWSRKEDGSVWQTVIVNEQLVIDRPALGTNGRFPFVHFVDHQNTWSVWAMGEVQQVEQLQISINRRRGHIQDLLRYTATPIMVVDPASGVEYENLRPRPNLVVPAEGGLQSIGWLQPPTIPNALFEANMLDKGDFDIVLGNVDVLQGRRPPGVEAGVAIEILQEAANVRMRLKVRNMENSIKQLGELLIGFIQEFYTAERVFRLVGTEMMKLAQPITKDMFFSINQPQGGMQIDAAGEPSVPMMNEIPPIGMAEFDVRIGPGSTLPISRVARFQQVMEMYTNHIVDDEEVLKNSGLPHWDEILMRSRQYWMGMQAMAAQQEAMSANGSVDNISDQDADLAMQAEAPASPGPAFE